LTGGDNCGTVTFTQSPVGGASLASSHNQTHNVVITASDGNGNTQTCTVVLTGKDVTKPTFTCPDNQNVNLNATCQLLVPNLIAELTGNDNCGTVTFMQSPLAGASLASSHNQTHNILITASDGNGNTQTCAVVLTGKDVTKPTYTCPYNQNVNLNGTCQLIVPNLIAGLTGSDNCGTVTFAQSPLAGASLASSQNQTHNVLITASDGNGNTQTCTVVLTGKDVTKPIFTCPYNQNVNLNGTCQLIVPNLISGLTGSDNCGTVTFSQSPVAGASFGSSHNQTHNVVITANDGNGNTESCMVVLTAKDVTPPVITCPSSKTISCDASILPVNTGSATATDNCGGNPVITYSDVSGQDPDPSHAAYYNYTITRTWKATDIATNTSTCNQTITVQDIAKPMITCPADKLSIPFDFGQLYATITIGAATATDNCAANPNVTIAGTRSDNVAINNLQYPLGTTTVSWSATDPSSNSIDCIQTVTVRKRNTAVVYTGDMVDSKICVQYSDIINLQAKLTDYEGLVTPNNISGRTITFQLLSGTTVLRSKSATTNASGVVVDTFKIEQAPGMYSVKTIFAGDAYFNGSNDQDNCEVKQEDVIVEYNGSQYFTTASSTTLVGSITLAASLNDINDGNDKRGDIRKAKATFRDGGPASTVIGSANLPVGLVNPSVLTDGLSATTQNNIILNSNDASSGGKIFQVWVGASDHYTGADAGPTPVTLALPGQDFVTGGGHLVLTNSAGTYAGTLNSKMNFGFTMKWNKSGKNLQGNINIVFRKWQLYNGVWQWRVYQAKSNAINSMAVVEVGANGQPVSGTNPAAFRKAIINTKANLKDVTDPLNNIDLGGNHNLTLDAWDHITANGGVSDKISVTLMGATTNELLFSSSWISNATAAQTITGGNINVRNGSLSSSTSINTITKSNQMEATEKEDVFIVKAYPNPTSHQFTLTISSNSNEAIIIQVYDAAGRKIQTLNATADETIRFGEKLKAGVYVAQVIQGIKKESIKLIKQ
ncbi:MAG TPA: T9SS type A sorting domain-containing protein, partial [Chitinophagaceae bacterium]|nr:T9SS type A sorting domain-containing protein [Chitinophagaceae bacterium]